MCYRQTGYVTRCARAAADVRSTVSSFREAAEKDESAVTREYSQARLLNSSSGRQLLNVMSREWIVWRKMSMKKRVSFAVGHLPWPHECVPNETRFSKSKCNRKVLCNYLWYIWSMSSCMLSDPVDHYSTCSANKSSKMSTTCLNTLIMSLFWDVRSVRVKVSMLFAASLDNTAVFQIACKCI